MQELVTRCSNKKSATRCGGEEGGVEGGGGRETGMQRVETGREGCHGLRSHALVPTIDLNHVQEEDQDISPRNRSGVSVVGSGAAGSSRAGAVSAPKPKVKAKSVRKK